MSTLRGAVLRAVDGARGVVVMLSENPMHDTGGGQRSAQMTKELLRRGHAVLFVSRGVTSMSLYYHEDRWWIASWSTQPEGDEPLPQKYLVK